MVDYDLRIFDFLNFSGHRHVFGDSGFHVQRLMVKAMSDVKDWHFYLTVPRLQREKQEREMMKQLEREFEDCNVTLIPYEYPSGGPEIRFDFPMRTIRKLIDPDRRDYDLIYSNLPEIVPNFLQLFNRKFHFGIPAVSYCHWLDHPELRENDGYDQGLHALMIGFLNSTRGACNSHYARGMILEYAKRWFNEEVMKELERRILPLWLGLPVDEMMEYFTEEKDTIPGSGLEFNKPTIVFNFRLQQYTGTMDFLEAMEPIWKTRNDFQIIFTNPTSLPRLMTKLKRKYGEMIILPRRPLSWPEYVQLLWRSDVVVGFHQWFTSWSLSLPEAVICECYPLVQQKYYWPEIFEKDGKPIDDFIYFDGVRDFRFKIRHILDNIEDFRPRARKLSSHLRNKFHWRYRLKDWIPFFEEAVDEGSRFFSKKTNVAKTKAPEIIEFINWKKQVTKYEILAKFKWGTNRKWTKYRAAILQAGIFENMRQTETIFSSEPIFIERKQVALDFWKNGRKDPQLDLSFFMQSVKDLPKRYQKAIVRILDSRNIVKDIAFILNRGFLLNREQIVNILKDWKILKGKDPEYFESRRPKRVSKKSTREDEKDSLKTGLSKYR